jgi:hypothetical protein
MTTEYMKAAELAKKVAELNRRKLAITEAVAQAQKRIAERGQFVPKSPRPARSVTMRF